MKRADKVQMATRVNRSEEGLTLETSASLSFHAGNLTFINVFDTQTEFSCFINPPTGHPVSLDGRPFIWFIV